MLDSQNVKLDQILGGALSNIKAQTRRLYSIDYLLGARVIDVICAVAECAMNRSLISNFINEK